MDTALSLDFTDLNRPKLTRTEPRPEGPKQVLLAEDGARLYAYVTADQAYDIAAAWFDLATEMRRRWPHLYGPQRFDDTPTEPEAAPVADLDDPGELEDYLASLDEVAP